MSGIGSFFTIIALLCTLIGLYLNIKRDYKKASLTWNIATAALWITFVSLIAAK